MIPLPVPRGVLAALVLASGLGAPPLAAAAPAPDAEARRLFDEGLAAHRDGRTADAMALLRRSYALEPVPVVLYNLALLELSAGDFAAAGNHLYAYLDTEAALTRRRRLEVQRLVEGQVRPRAVLVQVVGVEIGALVLVDGHRVSEAGLRYGHWTLPGPHDVSLPDGPTKTVTIALGDTALVELERPREGKSAAPGWIVAGVGVACAATGVVLLALAQGASSDVEGASIGTPWTDVRDRYEASRDLPVAGGVLAGVGAAATVTGLLLVLDADGSDADDDPDAAGSRPSLGVSGLGLGGAF